MGALGKFLATLFGGLFGFIAEKSSMEIGFKLLAVTSLTAVLTAIVMGFDSCSGGGICGQAFSAAADRFPTFSMGLGIAFNAVTYSAASSYVLVWTACQLYIFKKRMTSMLLSGS